VRDGSRSSRNAPHENAKERQEDSVQLENCPTQAKTGLEWATCQFAAPDKKRPALVLTRDSAIAYLSTVTVAPVTSTIRGVPSEVVLNEEDGMKSPCAVNLHNAVTVSQQRLGKRVAQLSSARMNEVCAALRFSLGCDSN
jgi:mRNA interferase MazF